MSTDSNRTGELSAFVGRHIGPTSTDVEQMLQTIGVSDLDALVNATMPSQIRFNDVLNIPAASSENAVLAELAEKAARNTVKDSMIGLGYYGTIMPSVIRRRVLENPAWYTAYTPYQPEISQGRLEALLNFQTMCSDLTGIDIANASLLDEGTAAGEAVTLMRRASKAAKDAVVVVDADLFPQTKSVIKTRSWPVGITVVEADLSGVTDAASLKEAAGGHEVFGVIVQYPGASGQIRDYAALAEAVHEGKGLVAAAADLLALTLLTPPGEWGADIAVGTSQRFGVPMQFGGPHAGYMVVRKGLERNMPGRLVGTSVDADGNPANRLALQTREQHIRREKATSNICTAQALLAILASMYAVYHGPAGLKKIATTVHAHARVIADKLTAAGVNVITDRFFDTLTVSVPGGAGDILLKAVAHGINVWRANDDTILLSCDETTDSDTVSRLLSAFGVKISAEEVDELVSGLLPEGKELTAALSQEWGQAFARTSAFLTAEAFNTVHSESQMLRYQRKLSDKDYALDRGMIPLGSCTMKLNAATEMEAVTWPEFANLHPFAPADQTQGIREIITDLQRWLVEITGYDAFTLQPNSGAAGELAALTAIRDYHTSRGEGERDICLIPSSAHGTNAASAGMAGFKVVVVKSTEGGEIDLEDLRSKLDKHAGKVAAIMITYPSTHGVYEDTVTTLTELVHAEGGQVYIDGANMNALVGVAKPGQFGGDASHLNLHKTFAIPHGGGGPGVGPVGVKSHLAPFLPNHPLDPSAGPQTGSGPCASAPFGSAGVLPITWAYIRLMGGRGLKQATYSAVLNANYIAARLRDSYPVLYSNDGIVAHECILDLRKLTHDSGVTVDDVAKRLIDYGFHAPTMSFPVAGTLMVEPTESEDKEELDRFCDAMIAIRAEIQQVQDGQVAVQESVLRNAPHTAASIAGEWNHPYSRELAVFPGNVDPASKYWPPVRRIDGAFGDRNLVCTCPPMESYED
ncbi:aminomethyl-transferring glycine dehydrogenase [Dermatophilus congolensis]|uniref:aminomethyl-transferring glycine dehydrogenase n=1 Tax=Dermatophilus congolensis TaxID=1863 RepID=UPI001AAEBF54|nr:aminomethyl-transferring glycine dehydrogenase [Dermatophilus congolensis]MBO3142800.1 aminomethyl-transferring glycine dehydrogenase [Dermatophilus congolensis]MBO3151793.1 aminomethyl-transferring glycine dehydrogenase [Dermatophilus congolensis]MBO3161204.1 aminomethyl-transferring glycine dehydrogenase [Dermatophilus congolensis]MBO3163075.1 aminomethyl-transferring glycine dehydrogenase [Dermatophilus congolensis]MBO3176628.1 aminomethyl-transferring glycine dehydrogenase [Dermatophilu